MPEYVTKINTADGVKRIDYNALANKPPVGSVDDLQTKDKSSLVAAINELLGGSNAVSPEQISAAVSEYLSEHPVSSEDTEARNTIEQLRQAIEAITTSGYTFTPTVSSEGVLSWTNDGGLQNPDPVNIRGPQGVPGERGLTGPKGDTYSSDLIEMQDSQPTSDTNRVWIATGEEEIEIPTMDDLTREKEWVLVGTIDTGNKASGVNVDLSGCTELVITGYTTATDSTNMYGVVGGERMTMIGGASTNGVRTFFASFQDNRLGVFGNGKYSTNAGAVSVGNVLNCYILIGVSVEELTRIYFSNPANITDCNVKIYAR